MENQIHEFGSFRISAFTRTLWRDGVEISLTGREFETLWALVQRPGIPVRQEILIKEVWGNTTVTDSNLRHQVSALRRKLGKDANGKEYILSIPNEGYQLAAEVISEDEPSESTAQATVDETAEVIRSKFDRPTNSTAAAKLDPGMLRLHSKWIPSLAIFGLAILVIALVRTREPQPAPKFRTPVGRIFARYTSEGSRRTYVPLMESPNFLAISPNGGRVFAIGDRSRTLSIITTADLHVRNLELPRFGGPMAVTPDGVLYIASVLEGVMVVSTDREAGATLREVVATGGPVRSLQLSLDGEKLFLAMSSAGVKVLSTRSKKLGQLTDRVCPENLVMDAEGKRLYVAYQCYGPMGRPGHDSVEIFDVATGASLGVIQGPPVVAAAPAISPDGRLLMIDGADACANPKYDHEGCPLVPSRVLHLFRLADRQLVQTLAYPMETNGPVRFVDNSRFLLTGSTISVHDAARYTPVERMEGEFGGTVFAPNGSRAYIASAKPRGVLVLESEGADCAPPPNFGLAVHYPADGTFEDSVNSWRLSPHGGVRFLPGRVGQAFYFDGGGFLSAASLGHYNSVIGSRDMSLSLYAKLAGDHGNEALLDWKGGGPSGEIRLVASENHRLIFQAWPGGILVRSKSSVTANTWYHIAVTRTENEIALYINGEDEGHGSAPPQVGDAYTSLTLGGYSSGSPAFRGWLDEVAFYSRALTAKEVRDLYELREHGPCKM
jgi:DNA-binding winged helix-turn-helix (wHTH) protein